jgi:hypothetical protein
VADVRVVQRGRSLGFPLEAAERLCVVGEFVGKELQGNVATELQVFRLIHNPHGPRDLAEDTVVRNALADHGVAVWQAGHERQVNASRRVGKVFKRMVGVTSPLRSLTGYECNGLIDSLGPAPTRQSDTVNALAPFTLDESRYSFFEVGVLGPALVRQFVGPDWVAPLPSNLHLPIRTLYEKEPFENRFTGPPMPCGWREHAILFKQPLHDASDLINRNRIGTKHLPLRHIQMERNDELL